MVLEGLMVSERLMAGNREGGLLAAQKNLERYGEDFYRVIGRKGGLKTHIDGSKPKGFATNIPLAREAGRRGGKKSKRRPSDRNA
jgi:general stress protein YciG